MSMLVIGSSTSQTSSTTLTTISASSPVFGAVTRLDGCNIYVGVEPRLDHEKEQATACLNLNGMHFQENDPVSASHIFCFLSRIPF